MLPSVPGRSAAIVAGAALTIAVALSGCTSSTPAPAGTGDSLIAVVCSTDVYGDIAAVIGGDRVEVSSILTDPTRDPHSFEGSARVQLNLSKAEVVIKNGGGYDDWVDTLLAGANNPDAILINAVDVSGFDQKPASGQFNEHVFYSFTAMGRLADTLAKEFSTLRPDAASSFTGNAEGFKASLAGLIARTDEIKDMFAGTGVAVTEPVPGYLTEAAGLVNKTPEGFSAAIEVGTDIPPAVLADTLALFSSKSVTVLLYNEQTSGPQTEQVLAAAKVAGVSVVPVRETLPADTDYLTWMSTNVAALKTSLGG